MGWWGAGQCFGTQVQAAESICASFNRATEAGMVVCSNPQVQPTYHGYTVNRWTPATGSFQAQTVTIQWRTCEETAAPNFPWNLSVSEGAQISAAILGVWALAWCLRALRRALSSDGNPESE